MVASYKTRGLQDWLIQRVTAVFLAIYFIYLLSLLFTHGVDSYFVWKSLFGQLWMKVATDIAVICIALHAWVGLWTVFTDYVKSAKLRYGLQTLVIVVLVLYVAWGVWAVWGI